MLTDENKCLRSRAWSPQCIFFFRCLTPETLAKRFHLWQSLPCLNEEGMPPFLCTLGGSLKHPCVALPRWRPGSSPTERNIGFVPGAAGCQHVVGLTCEECSPWQAASPWHRHQMISALIVAIYDFSCCLYESLLRQLGYPKSLNNSYSGKPDSR